MVWDSGYGIGLRLNGMILMFNGMRFRLNGMRLMLNGKKLRFILYEIKVIAVWYWG